MTYFPAASNAPQTTRKLNRTPKLAKGLNSAGTPRLDGTAGGVMSAEASVVMLMKDTRTANISFDCMTVISLVGRFVVPSK